MLLSLCLLLALAQDTPQEPATPPVFSMTCHGAETLFVDPKDQRLLQALQMVDDRLLELPGELDMVPIPPPAIGLLARLLGGPISLAVGIGDEPIPGMEIPVFGELRAARGVAEAQAISDDLEELLEMMGMPLDPPPAGELFELPAPVPVWLGAQESNFRICLGSANGLGAEDLGRLLPANAQASFTGMMDYGRFLDLFLESLPDGDDVEFEQIRSLLDGLGLDDLRYEWAMGSDPERQLMVVNIPGWGQGARDHGFLPDIELTPETLSCIPADATWAVASVFDVGGVMRAYRTMLQDLSGSEELDLFAMIEEGTGLNVEEDLIAPLGTSLCIYASDSTGGGGMFSTVAVLGLADRERFLGTWSKLESFMNEIGASEAEGYVRMSRWEQDGTEFSSLRFPGMPIPLELTMATTTTHAVFGASPQAVIAALAQLKNPSSNLLDHPGFQEQLPQNMEGCINVQWLNTPRLMRDGYGAVGLLCSSLANGVRSPLDASREPGAILPTFNELHQGSKGMLGIARVVGEDYHMEYRADRSQLVNAAGVAGFLYNSPFLALFATGMAGMLVAQETSDSFMITEDAIVEIDLEMIYQALDAYALNNGGLYPDTLDVLVIPDENGYAYLDDPSTLFDPWGDPYEYEPPTEESLRPYVFSRQYEK